MNSNSLRKVSWDMSRLQLSWASWFLIITLIMYTTILVFGGHAEVKDQLSELTERIVTGNWDQEAEVTERFGYISFVSHASKIFMLVLGIISVTGFMTFFVKQGVSRRTYFYGTILSSAAVSAMIALSAGLVHVLEILFLGTEKGFASAWVSAILIHALLIFAYFIFGWVIGASFYRSVKYGLLSILLELAFAFIMESLMNLSLMTRLSVPEEWRTAASLAGVAVLLTAALWIVRLITRNVPIRLK